MSDCLEGLPIDVVEAVKSAKDKKKFVQEMQVVNARKYKLLKMQKEKHVELLGILDAHSKGGVSALRSILTNDVHALAKNSNVEYRTHAINGQIQAKMVNVIEAISTRMLGTTRDVKLADDMVLEIHGTKTGNKEAVKLARQWEEASSFARERFNEAGGAIDKLESWGMPQSHDQLKVGKADIDEWVAFIKPLLKDSDIDLNKVYETISTGGANKLRDGGLDSSKFMGGGNIVANKNNDPRSLHFKDGDAWLKYQKEFGREDPLAVMLDHVRALSVDTALVEILGPNPENMFKTLHKEVQLREKLDDGQGGFEWYTNAIYNVVSGKVDTSASVSGVTQKFEAVMGTLRSVQTATKLGSAQLSAASDMGTMISNAKHHGMDATKLMASFAKNMDVKNQVEIARMGYAADVFNSTISSRFSEVGVGMSAQAAEALIRSTGLNMWTEAARKAFQSEFHYHLKDLSQSKGKVPEIFEQYGWSKAQFDNLDFDKLTLKQETRILEMVNQETDFAILVPTARTRAITTGGFQRGSVAGELARLTTQFKSFPITYMIQQFGRMFLQNSGNMTRAKYAAMVLTSTTVLGGMVVMMKDASLGYEEGRKGNPWDEDSSTEDMAKFWAAAAMQGGGAGLFGDFMFSDQNRYGGSALASLTGPTMGTAEKAVQLTIGNAQAWSDDKDTHLGSEAVDFANRELNPFNTWYTKAVIDNLVMENIKLLADDTYEEKQVKKATKRRREFGQEKIDMFKADNHNPLENAQSDVKALRSKYNKLYKNEEDSGKKKKILTKYQQETSKIKKSLPKNKQYSLEIKLLGSTQRSKSRFKPFLKKEKMIKF